MVERPKNIEMSCSGFHWRGECNSNQFYCINCKHAKQVSNMGDIQFSHSVFVKNCVVYKREL